MHHLPFVLSLSCVAALLAAENLFTDSDLPLADNDGYVSLEPSYEQLPPDLMSTDTSVDGDIFDLSEASTAAAGAAVELELLDDNNEKEEKTTSSSWVASAPDECTTSSSPRPAFRTRPRQQRRGAFCAEVDENKPYMPNFRDAAAKGAVKVSDIDLISCLGVLPYLICSSNDPTFTIYWPGILSWVLYESSRGAHRSYSSSASLTSSSFPFPSCVTP